MLETTYETTRRPRIGISAWLRPLPTFLGERTMLYTLGLEYVESVAQADGLPLIVPRAGSAEDVLDALDGLLLAGGDDVHPQSYGDGHTGESLGVDLESDQWEIALVRGAARRGMPVLGICRGMQVMSVAFGGRLVQNMAGLEGHPDIHDMTPDDILATRHDVQLDSGCVLTEIYGTTRREVNTIHHQAVVNAGDLQVTGYGPAGVIESIEPGWDWPAIGVQWHPEKLDDEAERRLFRHFVQVARSYAAGESGATSSVPAGKEHR